MGRIKKKYAGARGPARGRGRVAVRGGRFLSLGSRVTPKKRRLNFGAPTIRLSPRSPAARFPPSPARRTVKRVRYSGNKGAQHIDYLTASHGRRMRQHNKLAAKLQRSLVPVDSMTFTHATQHVLANAGYQQWIVLEAGKPDDINQISDYCKTRMANGQAQVAASGIQTSAGNVSFSGKFRIYDYEGTWTMKNQSQLACHMEIYEVIARQNVPRQSPLNGYDSIYDMVTAGFGRGDYSGVSANPSDITTSLYQNHMFCSWFKIVSKKAHFMAPGHELKLKLAHNSTRTINPLTTQLGSVASSAAIAEGHYTRAFVIRYMGEVVHSTLAGNAVTSGTAKLDILGMRKYHFNNILNLGTFDALVGSYDHSSAANLAFINVEVDAPDANGDNQA